MASLKINKAELKKNKYGQNDIVIKMLSLYVDGKWVKHIRLNNFAIKKIMKAEIEIDLNEEELERIYKSMEK